MIGYAIEFCGWRFWLGLFIGVIIVLWLVYGFRKDIDNDQTIDSTVAESEFSRTITKTEIDNTPNIPSELHITSIAIPLNNQKEETKKTFEYEEECRKIFEEIYNEKFPKSNPAWLVNPESNRRLELDGYCEKLKLAFEYNGPQHYIYPNWTGQSYDDFIKQIRRDNFKIDMCDKNGVYLVTIPYNIPKKKLREYIDYYRKENAANRVK